MGEAWDVVESGRSLWQATVARQVIAMAAAKGAIRIVYMTLPAWTGFPISLGAAVPKQAVP